MGRHEVSPETLIVYQVAGREHLESGAKKLKTVAERLFPGWSRRFIVVDQLKTNEVEESTLLMNEDCSFLPGDNSLREFTAYDKGLRYGENFSHADGAVYNPAVVVANESFHRHYGDDYLTDFTYEKARTVVEDDNFMGYVDAYPTTVQVFGYRFRSWIRSSIIIGQYQSFLDVYPFSIDVGDDIFCDDFNVFFSDTSKLSQSYKDMLRHWLLDADIRRDDFPQTWHSAETPGPDNIGKLRLKAKSIMCEQLFTARARYLGHGITVTN